MKIRAALHLGLSSANLVLQSMPGETPERLLLKLAGYVFHFDKDPVVDPSLKHPALLGQEYAPDLLVTDVTGAVSLWVECGKTTLHKLGKVSRRFHHARVIVLTARPHEGRQMAEGVSSEGIDRTEVWSFREGDFERWADLVQEKNEIIGEASETEMNLVLNAETFVTQLEKR